MTISEACHVTTQTDQQSPRRAGVIGSGFGGLAAAIRLQAKGYQTTLFEKLDKPGGRAYVFEDDGFKFDAGPTVITAPDCIAELFALVDRQMSDYVTLLPVEPMYRLFWEDGSTFDYHADGARLKGEIGRLSPGDLAGYDAYYEYALQVFKAGYEELCHVPFLSFWDMIKVAPDLLRLKAYNPVYKTVASFMTDERLRQAFSFASLLIGGNPFKASSIYTLIHPLERKWGVSFPAGGTHALVEGLVRLFRDIGGEVLLNTPVREVETSERRVRGLTSEDGRFYPLDLIVSNADVCHTYGKLLKNEQAVRGRSKRLHSRRQSMSLFVIYFGTNRQWSNLVHHNVLFGKRYKGLLDDIFNHGVVADDFSLYLHAPTLTDPALAPKGHHGFYVLAPVPHLGYGRLNWESLASSYADRILAYMEEHYMPGLRASIVTQRNFTPLDFESRLNAYQGAAFSLEPTLTQSAWFRVHNKDPSLEGMYFVGAGTHPGAGVPGVIGSAKATVCIIPPASATLASATPASATPASATQVRGSLAEIAR